MEEGIDQITEGVDQVSTWWVTLQELLVAYGFRIIGSIIILLVGWWLAKLITRWTRRGMERYHIDVTLTSFATNILYYLLLLVVGIAAVGNLGYQATSVIAILGAATFAVGLALQNSLSNFAAGVLIILFKPYKVGDLIETQDAFGRVEVVQIFNTRLITLDNKLVIIPNGKIIDDKIVNYSAKGIIRVDMMFGIGYGDDLLRAKQILLEILQDDERILESPAPIVAVAELGDSSVNFTVRPYVNTRDFIPIRFHVTEQVKLRFDEAGISIPFPQRDVHLFQAS